MNFLRNEHRVCRHCFIRTEQKPEPFKDGFRYVCLLCKNVTGILTVSDMENALLKRMTSEPPLEISTDVADNVRVFLKHHLGEAEASQESVQQHLRITGHLPVAGGKLMALPGGMTHKAFAIPIGEVLRIEEK